MKNNDINDVRALESRASKHLLVALDQELAYLKDMYNVAHKAYRSLDKSNALESKSLIRALMLITGRITDFLRSIHILITLGYPEQAGSLAASLFELAHTSYYLSYNNIAISSWLNATHSEEMPRLLGKNLTWKKIIKQNCDTPKLEFFDKDNQCEIYQKLCFMKHSHPAGQGFLAVTNSCETFLTLDLCPKYHEEAIRNSRFIILKTGLMVDFSVTTLVRHLNNSSLIDNELAHLRNQYNELSNRLKEENQLSPA